MDDEWVKLVTVGDDYQANLLVGRLDSAGIEARTLKNDPGAISYLRAGHDPDAPVDVYVLTDQLDDAQEELRAIESEVRDEEIEPDEIPVIAAGGGIRPLWTWVAVVLIALFVVTLLFADTPIARLLGFDL